MVPGGGKLQAEVPVSADLPVELATAIRSPPPVVTLRKTLSVG
jgi:hypothetical protein